MKHLFVVGEREKHEIEVDHSQWRKKATIRVDGKIRAKKRLPWRGTFCRLKIGKEETHEVELEWGGISPKIRCFVDGCLHPRGAIIPSRLEKPVHVATILVVCVIVAIIFYSIGWICGAARLIEEYKNINVTLVFKTSDGTLHRWSVSVEALEASIVQGCFERETLQYIELEDGVTGEIHWVADFRPFVDEQPFSEVISGVYTELPTDEVFVDKDVAFVHEVWYIVTQLTTYRSEMEETPKFPLETIIGGGGDCEDVAILIASMLKAAPVDYVVELVYMDANNPARPKEVNHVVVCVETPGGYKTILDGTSETVVYPFGEVYGWYFEV